MFKEYPYFALRPGMAIVLAILVIWSMIWKGIALWKAGRKGDLGWFVALFLINTMGILEIIYIYGFANKAPKTAHQTYRD